MRVALARLTLGGLILLIVTLGGCDRHPGVLEAIRASGKLVILTRNAPTSYFEGRDGIEGYEYELATRFARHLGVTPEFRLIDSAEGLLAAMHRGEGQLVAAGLTRTESRNRNFRFGPDYLSVRQEVVCRRGGPIPDGPKGLVGLTLRIPAGTSYSETLNRLRRNLPRLHWEEERDIDTEELLHQVWERKIDCTVADSNIVAINRRYLPELVVAFPVTAEQPLAWVIPQHADDLASLLDEWFARMEREGTLSRLYEAYYGYADAFDYVDLSRFMRRITTRLPPYRKAFQRAATRHGLPWTLLAAQAYQESHWNARAQSPTGVRGMMMLTLDTARELGIKSRLNASQSIDGGARYLADLVSRIPESVKGEDRLWFALAAYNVGLGHLNDARELAERLGRDPNRWVDLKEVLPLLEEGEYYRTLSHGYARGLEPVQYVQRIRDYRDLLEQWLARNIPVEKPVATADSK